jgi:hypothetical protein
MLSPSVVFGNVSTAFFFGIMSSRAKSKGMMGGREETRGDSATDSFAFLSSAEDINLEQDCRGELILGDSFDRSGLFGVSHDSIELMDSVKNKQATGSDTDLIVEK